MNDRAIIVAAVLGAASIAALIYVAEWLTSRYNPADFELWFMH